VSIKTQRNQSKDTLLPNNGLLSTYQDQGRRSSVYDEALHGKIKETSLSETKTEGLLTQNKAHLARYRNTAIYHKKQRFRIRSETSRVVDTTNIENNVLL
jgi:hypothetical protein